jgi:hypothetical protein
VPVDDWRLDMLAYTIKKMLNTYHDWRHTNNGKKLLKEHKKLKIKLRNRLTDSTYYIE